MNESQLKKFLIDSWNDEKEASMLYEQMASSETDLKKKNVYKKLAEIEKGHAELLEIEMEKLGVDTTKLKFKPRWRTRFLSLFGRIFGHTSLLRSLVRGEDEAIAGYAKHASEAIEKGLKENLSSIAIDEKSHFAVLSEMSGQFEDDPIAGERWHHGGGSIRDAIFGMNDGLLSTFSLVAGVSGAAVGNTIVLLAGVAGAIAGAISMAAGAFVSTRAEKEVMEKHLEMEKYEITAMPELEMEELALRYELKGVDPEHAREMAKQIFTDKGSALDTMAREELGFAPEELGSPLKAGITSGIFFTFGALIPIVPWIIFPGIWAFYISIIMSLGGFFFIGIGRTLATGRNPWKSGIEMFLIGTGAAIITYIIGSLVGIAI
ncbi:VIT1/CCC1 transporter family protein [Candidatus Borrarchaeum sp.]|uniref:VIT1/CCC1 transporter family protein n=1 Tax=Candidatus Borrarchaeum sp. TaxID=2846742 RepID=UPI00257A84E7|nr:VIT1/CCC1 transporter family protein [Candidatus Borrarchaeum sp.]